MAQGLGRFFNRVTAAAAAVAAAQVISFASPYTLGGYEGENPVSPTSVARYNKASDTSGGRSFAVSRSFAATSALGAEAQETRNLNDAKNPVVLGTNYRTLDQRSHFAPSQETRDYDPSRIRAEIDELATRHRDHGLDTKPVDPNAGLPVHTIRDTFGNVLMQGHAQSVEHLIALKLKEASTSADPTKQMVNLDNADLSEKTLGRKLNLTGFEMRNVSMKGADLQGALIQDCKFENVDAAGVNLKGATITMSSFDNVNLDGFVGDNKTKFRNCTMENVHMQEADAPGVTFENIRAKNLDWAGANFQGANISKLHVENLWAPGVDLSGSKIGELHVVGRQSNLDEAKFIKAEVGSSSFGTNEYGISMKQLKAAGSQWNNVEFNASDLSGSDFTRSRFIATDMRRVRTPEGAMSMNESDITGLNAGVDAKMTADRATINNVILLPQENFVFSGTAPLQKAYQSAVNAKTSEAHITNGEGDTIEAQAAKNIQLQQAALIKKRQMAAMAPSPFAGKKTPYG